MDKDLKINSSVLWNVCPACGEWWNTDIDICPDCKERGKNAKLVATCANCGKPVNKCDCEYKQS